MSKNKSAYEIQSLCMSAVSKKKIAYEIHCLCMSALSQKNLHMRSNDFTCLVSPKTAYEIHYLCMSSLSQKNLHMKSNIFTCLLSKKKNCCCMSTTYCDLLQVYCCILRSTVFAIVKFIFLALTSTSCAHVLRIVL